MSFTVVRAVRGAEVVAAESADRLRRTAPVVPPPPASMDLPYADEVLHLEIGDFAETVPAALE
jgi:hypothetical protein